MIYEGNWAFVDISRHAEHTHERVKGVRGVSRIIGLIGLTWPLDPRCTLGRIRGTRLFQNRKYQSPYLPCSTIFLTLIVRMMASERYDLWLYHTEMGFVVFFSCARKLIRFQTVLSEKAKVWLSQLPRINAAGKVVGLGERIKAGRRRENTSWWFMQASFGRIKTCTNKYTYVEWPLIYWTWNRGRRT